MGVMFKSDDEGFEGMQLEEGEGPQVTRMKSGRTALSHPQRFNLRR
jgi:hypothetical protein